MDLVDLWHRFMTSPRKAEWLQAVASIATLVLTGGLALLTFWYVRVTARQVKANLLMPLLVEYGSREMGDAIRAVRAYQLKYGEQFFSTAFQNALSTSDPQALARFQVDRNEALAIDAGPRRMLSQYFYRVRALVEEDMIDRRLAARQLGPEPIDVYLEIVDPLDQAQRRALHRGGTHGTRDFFTELRKLAPEE